MDTTWTGSAGVRYGAPEKDIQTDVVIIGGGLTGVMTAYLMRRAGKSVVLLEQQSIGGGATGATTAFLSQSIDMPIADLAGMYGEDGARMVWNAGGEAIAEILRIAREETITCELTECPARIFAKDEREYSVLVREAAAAEALHFTVDLKKDDALAFPNAGYLEVPAQAKFHPLQFLQQLATRAHDNGVGIFENTKVTGITETGPVIVTTAGGATIRANDAIVATYAPFNNPKATHFKKGMYRSYVLEAHVSDCRIPEGIYWDIRSPYDYFRVDHVHDGVRVIVGGADHRIELPVNQKKCFTVLEEFLKSILGGIPYRVIRTWSGQILESSDGIPLIGPYAPHRYVATAFSGNGMTYAVISAMLIGDLITGVQNPWAGLFDPARALQPYRLWKKGLDYAREFFGGAMKTWFS